MINSNTLFKYSLLVLVSSTLLITGCSKSENESSESSHTSPANTHKIDTTGGEAYDSSGGHQTKHVYGAEEENH